MGVAETDGMPWTGCWCWVLRSTFLERPWPLTPIQLNRKVHVTFGGDRADVNAHVATTAHRNVRMIAPYLHFV